MMNCLNRCKPLLGTYVEVSIKAELSEDDLLDLSIDAFDAINDVHNLLGFHDPQSELSKVNRLAATECVAVSTPMREVLETALMISHASNGLFDITVAPTLIRQGSLPNLHQDSIVSSTGVSGEKSGGNWQSIVLTDAGVEFLAPVLIDLGGIAKGYAVDQAIKSVLRGSKAQGIDITVNAGGDLYMSQWQERSVAVRLPDSPSSHLDLPMLAPAVATSACYYSDSVGGDGQRQSVMIDPRKAAAVDQSYSVSVFAQSCIIADALTKLAFLHPEDGALIQSLGGQGLIMNQAGEVNLL